jgi:hypothetical protein
VDRDDVPRALRVAADEVLGQRQHARDLQAHAPLGERRHRGGDRGRAGHVLLLGRERPAAPELQPAGVERHPHADQHDVRDRVRRQVAQLDEPGRRRGPATDREQAAESLLLEGLLVAHDDVAHPGDQRSDLRRQLVRALAVGRQVHEVARRAGRPRIRRRPGDAVARVVEPARRDQQRDLGEPVGGALAIA